MEDGSAERADLFVATEKMEPLQSPPGSPEAKQSNQSSPHHESNSDGEDAHGSTSLPMQIPEQREALTPTSPTPGLNTLMNNTPPSPDCVYWRRVVGLDEERAENDLFFSLNPLTLQDDSSTPPTLSTTSSGFIDDETWITWSGDSGDSSITADMV